MSVAELEVDPHRQFEQDKTLPYDAGLFSMLDELTDLSDEDEQPSKKVCIASLWYCRDLIQSSRPSN